MAQTEQRQDTEPLSNFFRESPLVAVQIDLTRDKSLWREPQFLDEDDSDARSDCGNTRESD